MIGRMVGLYAERLLHASYGAVYKCERSVILEDIVEDCKDEAGVVTAVTAIRDGLMQAAADEDDRTCSKGSIG